MTRQTLTRLHTLRRALALSVLGAILAVAFGAATALSFFSGNGVTAQASASVGAMSVPSTPATSQAGAVVLISWGASQLSDGTGSPGYTVTRSDGHVVCGGASPVAGLSCTDASAPAGTYTYVVKATFNGFSASASTPSLTVLTAPAITGKPASPSANSTPAFSFSGGNGTGYMCQLDTGAFSSCTSGTALGGLTDAAHTLNVRAISGGSYGPSASYTWTIATGAPTLNGKPSDPTTNTSAPFTFSTSQSSYTLRCKLDSGSFTTCPYQTSLTSRTPAPGAFYRMNGSMTDSIASHDGTLSGGATAAGPLATDGNGGAMTFPAGSGFTETGYVPSSAFTLEAWVKTKSGTLGSSCYPCQWYSGESLLNAEQGGVTTDFGLTLTGGHAAFGVGAPDTTISSPATINDGRYHLLDATWSASDGVMSLYVDGQQVASTNGPTGARNAASIVYGGSSYVNQANSLGPVTLADIGLYPGRLTATQIGADYAAGSMNTNLAPGTHTFQVQAVDPDGVATQTSSYSWTVDGAPPTITGKPSDPSTNVSPSFAFTGAQSAYTFMCQLDGGGYSACSSPVQYTSLPNGSHVFQVEAISADDSTSAPATYTWTVEPTVTSVSPTSAYAGITNLNVTVSGVNFENGAQASFSGSGITVNSTTYVSPTQLTANVSIASSASIATRDVTVSNPDNTSGTEAAAFSVVAEAPPSGGALSVNGAAATTSGSSSLTDSSSFTIGGRTDYTETASNTESGLSSSKLTVQSASTSGALPGAGSCGAAGSGGPFTTPVTVTGTAQPSGIVAGYCYIYTLTGTDNLGKTSSVSTTVQVAMKLWAAADSISGSNNSSVTSWPDSSPFGNNLTTHATAPTLNTAQWNGHSAVTFNGSASDLGSAQNMQGGAAPYDMFIVARPNNLNIMGMAGWGVASQNNRVSFRTYGGCNGLWTYWWYHDQGGCFSSPTISTTGPGVYESYWDGTTRGMALNGVDVGHTTDSGKATVATPFYLGESDSSSQAATEPYNGQIAEAIVYEGQLTSSDRTAITNYLMGRYAVPIASSISPTSGDQGVSDTNVTITGSNFVNGATVSFANSGITVNSVTVNSSTQLTANINIAAGSSSGAGNVTVTSPSGTSSTLNNAFTVNSGSVAWLANGNANDVSGANNGTWSGTARYAAGASGAGGDSAFSFTGDGSAVTMNPTVGAFGTNTATIAFEINTTASGGSVLGERSACGNPGQGWFDVRLPNGHVAVEWGGNTYSSLTSTVAVNDGRWHNVVLRRFSSGTYTITIDGASAGSGSNGVATINPGVPFGIDNSPCKYADGTPAFVGGIDDVVLTNGN